MDAEPEEDLFLSGTYDRPCGIMLFEEDECYARYCDDEVDEEMQDTMAAEEWDDLASEIWDYYGGAEAAGERRGSLQPTVCGSYESAEIETREWLAWYEILSAQSYPPKFLPTAEEVQMRAGTKPKSPTLSFPRPITIPSIRYEKMHGTWRIPKLVPLRLTRPLAFGHEELTDAGCGFRC